MAEFARHERSRLEQLRGHETLPAFTELRSSDDGRLWLKDYPDYELRTVAWYRLSMAGQLVGLVTLPMDERLLAVTDSQLATVVTDELDVATVILYELIGLIGG